MKIKTFHQFILLEKGIKNTAIFNFLENNMFQVENDTLEKFEMGNHKEIPDFIKDLEKEGLIIEIDKDTWIPSVSLETEEMEQMPLTLEIEEGADIDLVGQKFHDLKVSKINFFGSSVPDEILPFVPVSSKKKDFTNCLNLCKIEGEFAEIEEYFYGFNQHFNSCWGRKLAITKDGKVRPCIYSEIIMADLHKDRLEVILEEAEKYWTITKDKVETCKDCELRYACFDCREIAVRAEGNLHAPNPHCKYKPHEGTWTE